MIIKIDELVKGKKTYPSWTTNSEYDILSEKIRDGTVKVYYLIEKGIKRKIERKFPAVINCNPSFCWTMGLIKGEGSNSLGKSSYRRFTITNKDPSLIKKVLEELEEKRLFHRKNLTAKSCHLLHFTEKEERVISYWSKRLNLPKTKFKCFNAERNTSKYGVCHVYISDTLLRRILDIINYKIANFKTRN